MSRSETSTLSVSYILGLGRAAVRRDHQRFPQLATQVRCSTGFVHVPSGRLEVAKAEQPELPAHRRGKPARRTDG